MSKVLFAVSRRVTMRDALLGVLLATILAGCPSDPAMPDAVIDGPVDARRDALVDAGPCGAETFLTGDFVDWDSTTVNFKGIFDASFTVDGAPTRTDKTSPNGRFELCIVTTARTRLSVDAPGVSAAGYVDALLIADQAVLDIAGSVSTRSFTNARAMSFYTEQNIAGGYDVSKAQLLVQTIGTPRAVTIDRVASPRGLNGETWSATAAGSEVLFANLDPTQDQVVVGSSGVVVGAGAVPLVAGKLTFVTLVLQ
ncbi:MAG: hypothetical protein KBG15_02085 [Kofleriaceae bacterium]|nr:hypothetical protein [Kofleriaceae bacterium]